MTQNTVFDLTSRESEVLAELARGRSNKEIARALIITEATVVNHLHHIYRKLAVKSRLEAAIWVLIHGQVR
jgi:DNA-binding NarL/FixJ family response regulator